MPIRLPEPIERYVAAENSGDLDSLDEIFAAGAVVRDEGGIHAGLDAIRKWMAGTREKYGHRMTPLASEDRAHGSVVEIRMTGRFPGSPVTLDFAFTLAAGKIESLEIAS